MRSVTVNMPLRGQRAMPSIKEAAPLDVCPPVTYSLMKNYFTPSTRGRRRLTSSMATFLSGIRFNQQSLSRTDSFSLRRRNIQKLFFGSLTNSMYTNVHFFSILIFLLSSWIDASESAALPGRVPADGDTNDGRTRPAAPTIAAFLGLGQDCTPCTQTACLSVQSANCVLCLSKAVSSPL